MAVGADIDWQDEGAAAAFLERVGPRATLGLAVRAVLRALPLIDGAAAWAPVALASARALTAAAAVAEGEALQGGGGIAVERLPAAAHAALRQVAALGAEHGDAPAPTARRAAAAVARAAGVAAQAASLVAGGETRPVVSAAIEAVRLAQGALETQSDRVARAGLVALRRDADRLAKRHDGAWLMTRPLWTQAPPGRIAARWSALKAQLTADGQEWWVWTEWYEGHRDGTRTRQLLEARVALLAEWVWDGGPGAVNGAFAELMRAEAEEAAEASRDVLDGVDEAAEMLLAARSMMRALPLAARALGSRADAGAVRALSLLPILRGVAALWLMPGSARAIELRTAMGWAADTVRRAPTETRLGRSLARLNAQLTFVAALVDPHAPPGSAYEFAADDLRGGLRADIEALTLGSLERAPLWNGEAPDWARENDGRLWQALEGGWGTSDGVWAERWSVWRDWYAARLAGAAFDRGVEEAVVLLDDALWAEGPATVNRAIAELRGAALEAAEEPAGEEGAAGPLRVGLVGPFTVEAPDGRSLRPGDRRVAALLAYLAWQRGREMPRSRLTDLIWPGHAGEEGRPTQGATLQRALSELRVSLGQYAPRTLMVTKVGVALHDTHIAYDLWRPDGSVDETRRGFVLEDLDGVSPAFDAWLREIRGEARGTAAVPEERAAPLQFDVVAGRLEVVAAAGAPDAAALESARLGMLALIEDFAAAGGARQDPRLSRLVARLAAALEARDAVLLGVHAGRFSRLVARADEMFMPGDAAELVALDLELARYLAHCPDWAAYAEEVSLPFGAEAEEQAAVADAAVAMAAIAEADPDLVPAESLEALEPLREAATPEPGADDPEPVAPAMERRSYLRAVRSALRAIAYHALSPVAKGAARAVEKVSEIAVMGAAGIGGVAALGALATRLPSEFGWLRLVAERMAQVVGLP